MLLSRFPPEAIAAVRNELAVVAHGMHTGHGLGETREVPASHATDSEIGHMLEYYRQASVQFQEGFLAVNAARDRLLSDSGLLLPSGANEASFFTYRYRSSSRQSGWPKSTGTDCWWSCATGRPGPTGATRCRFSTAASLPTT